MRKVLLIDTKFLTGWEGMGSKAQAGGRDTSSIVIGDRPVIELREINMLAWGPKQFPKNC